ncbi:MULTISPECIES: SDR family NAD(P)-dependent oxidoreductase [Amycolatopsis]|uniref:SDR family NAD(P)-dependent oxidoreductase n=1 Tax=Amycolatopsis albidoflavus TaxID=102226 RepID=A0ABW5I8L5_9PSEU
MDGPARIVVVTGAGSGIGRAIAKRFAKGGDVVVVADLDLDAANATARELDGGPRTVAALVDVSDEASVAAMADVVLTAYGRVDVLVNNAGVCDDFSLPHAMSTPTWQHTLAVNLTGPFLASRALLPSMIAHRSGVLVNVASESGLRGNAGGPAYTAAKHGLVGLTKSTAFLYAQDGIRCNAVCPGAVRTNIMSRPPDPEGVARLEPSLRAAGTPVEPDRIASVVHFLASDAAANVNGVILPADGGWSAG